MKKLLILLIICLLFVLNIKGAILKLADDHAKWQTQSAEGNSLEMKKADVGFIVEYSMPIEGQWVQILQGSTESFDNIKEIIIEYKGTGANNTIEIKLEDVDGSVFGKRMNQASAQKKWKQVKLTSSQLEYWWGGDKKMGQLRNIFIALSGSGDGTVEIKQFNIITKAGSVKKKNKKMSAKDLKKLKKYSTKKNWDDPSQWETSNDGESTIDIKSASAVVKKGLEVKYTLRTSEAGWVIMKKDLSGVSKNKKNKPVSFLIKAESISFLEIKFIDMDDSVFGKKISLAGQYEQWTPVTIAINDTEYWWGGDKEFTELKAFEFAISGSGEGTIWLDEIGFRKKK